MTVEPLLGGISGTDPHPLLRAGNTNCGGCGMSIAWRFLSRAVADRPVQIAIPACCGIVTAGPFPTSAYGAPVVSSTFAATAAMATGMSVYSNLNEERTRTICWAGDGGTYDIGMAALSAAAERNEDILYICYDNEIYGNTGGQRSSATPRGAATTTTPTGKMVEKKDILGIMMAHQIPYLASISMADASDSIRKMRYALDLKGFRFLHLLSPCPTGWKSEPAEGIALLRLAVRSGLYPVFEVFEGKLVINQEPEMSDESLERYFAAQGRFEKIDLKQVREAINAHWKSLRARAADNG